jgi:hypothetical protein
MSYASRRSVVARGLDTIKATKGEKTSDIEGLSLDADYTKQQDLRRSQRVVPPGELRAQSQRVDPRELSQRLPPHKR